MIKRLATASMIIVTIFALGGTAVINNFAMGQTNTTTTNGSDGNAAKMHVDEALKAL
ncbi:MAG: hypothetical protein L0H53_15735 [Candidatus Nitrosocosmicus sp.]|nr:hypothetical protein [Candidatus Nitrosocosmicus sp.]MDN5868828.1 hypothetical protein [Candidatus Nitrosocosmicus sp.]